MSKTTWIIFIVAVLALFGGLVYVSSKDAINVSDIDGSKVQPAASVSGDIADHTSGSDKNKIVLIEYGDFQCPGCMSAHQPMKEVTEKYKNEVTFVFRNYPLTNAHPNAKVAAAAAEAAGEMGKYWEMHDILYEQQNDWKNATIKDRGEIFAGYADQIGLDENEFSKKLEENAAAYNKKIAFDLALGKKMDVSGTPTFYLNGKKIDQNLKDGKLVDASDPDGTSVWGDAAAFGKLIIEPALTEAGIPIPEEE